MTRLVLSFVPFVSTLMMGCGPEVSPDPGQATGACVEDACNGELQCVDEVCVDPNSTQGGTGPNTAATGGGSEDGPDPDTGEPPVPSTSVSVLVVMDNSGSMGEEQGRIGPALGVLADSLTEAGVDWRLGVTTTDNGNPWCTGTTPEGGELRLSSCRARQAEFIFDGATAVDAVDAACLSICNQDIIPILPTAVDGGDSAPRPWFESIAGVSNLEDGLVADAVACAAPQGINGCGFEQPLESMFKAVARAEVEGKGSYGFVPAGALLVVLLVTDEVDCSYNQEHESIFLPDGDRTFWSLPDEGAPTSAVCWNAGVSCNAGECTSVNLDVTGENTSANDAVMRPVSRYIDGLNGTEAAMVMLLAGSAADGSVTYQDSADPIFQDNFGTGAGCENAVSGPAVPPVRGREVAEAFPLGGGQSLFSICEDDYTPAMSAVANAIIERLD